MNKIIMVSALCLSTLSMAQKPVLLKQADLSQWAIAPGNYSGITPIAADSFAVIDDKSPLDGFYVFRIGMDAKDGTLRDVDRSKLHAVLEASDDLAVRGRSDCEDIVYVPSSRTFFITSEHRQDVLEYDMQGRRTGRRLAVPGQFGPDRIRPNSGFEALAYSEQTRLFWLTTETALPADGLCLAANGRDSVNGLRLQSFTADLQPGAQWAYRMEPPQVRNQGLYYAHGVPAMVALPDGRLIVMERELNVPSVYLGAKAIIRLFLVQPSASLHVSSDVPLHKLRYDRFLPKQELTSFTTHLRLSELNYANYEGMCLGPVLADGRRTLLLINDSQAGAGNSLYHLRDYLKVIILPSDVCK